MIYLSRLLLLLQLLLLDVGLFCCHWCITHQISVSCAALCYWPTRHLAQSKQHNATSDRTPKTNNDCGWLTAQGERLEYGPVDQPCSLDKRSSVSVQVTCNAKESIIPPWQGSCASVDRCTLQQPSSGLWLHQNADRSLLHASSSTDDCSDWIRPY